LNPKCTQKETMGRSVVGQKKKRTYGKYTSLSRWGKRGSKNRALKRGNWDSKGSEGSRSQGVEKCIREEKTKKRPQLSQDWQMEHMNQKGFCRKNPEKMEKEKQKGNTKEE